MKIEDELLDELRQIKCYLKAIALSRVEQLWGPEKDEDANMVTAKGAISEALGLERPKFHDDEDDDEDELIMGIR